MSTENYDDLVREYNEIQDKIAPDQARLEEIKKVFRGLGYGTHEIAGCKIQVSRNSRFNPTRFEADYPILQNPGLYQPKPNMDAIKDRLAPSELRQYRDEGNPSVTVK